MSKVNVRNTTEGIKCLPPCTETGQPMLPLMPGTVTPVDEKRLQALDDNAVVVNWFSAGDLEPVDFVLRSPEVAVPDDSHPVLPLDLSELTVAKATPMLAETDDQHLLNLWLEAEERAPLKDAISARIPELTDGE